MPRLAHTACADCSRSPRLMRRGERDEQGTGQEEGTEKEAAQDDEGKKGREARQERFQAIFTDVSARRPTDEKKARHCPGLFSLAGQCHWRRWPGARLRQQRGPLGGGELVACQRLGARQLVR